LRKKILTSKTRLDRFLSRKLHINKRDVRLLLSQKRVIVDSHIASDVQQIIHPFTQVSLDGKVLQENQACYLMMHKPLGVVSATQDKIHKTVIDLLAHPLKHSLHITGRLDLNSTGLLLLTNDSQWSRKLMSPDNKVSKRYLVTVKKPIIEEYINAFHAGMNFPYEDITTLPVKLEIINPFQAELSLIEGRYHQIKRMFGRFRNPVLEIHRLSIGSINLDPFLLTGEYRALNTEEINLFQS